MQNERRVAVVIAHEMAHMVSHQALQHASNLYCQCRAADPAELRGTGLGRRNTLPPVMGENVLIRATRRIDGEQVSPSEESSE